jgi:hypothetical protein
MNETEYNQKLADLVLSLREKYDSSIWMQKEMAEMGAEDMAKNFSCYARAYSVAMHLVCRQFPFLKEGTDD